LQAGGRRFDPATLHFTGSDDGKLRIEATSFLLSATARDAAGNATTVTATPKFNDHGENEDDEDDHGKKGGGKKDGDRDD
jgi:hypothetical protein